MVFSIVVRFLSATHGARRSDMKKIKQQPPKAAENPEICACDYSVIDDAGWHLAWRKTSMQEREWNLETSLFQPDLGESTHHSCNLPTSLVPDTIQIH